MSLKPQSLPGLRLFLLGESMRWEMIVVLLVVLLLVVRSLLQRDRDARSAIDLEDLLLGADGRASKAAAVMFGAFLLTSWVIVYQTLTDKLTDLTFGAYLAAWVAPTVTALITNGGRREPPQQ